MIDDVDTTATTATPPAGGCIVPVMAISMTLAEMANPALMKLSWNVNNFLSIEVFQERGDANYEYKSQTSLLRHKTHR